MRRMLNYLQSKDSSHQSKLQHKLYLAETNPEPVFDLGNCDLNQLPNGIYKKCRVYLKEKLILRGNRLTSVPNNDENQLRDLRIVIRHLDLSLNFITKIPNDLCLLNSLQELHLGRNKLNKLPSKFSQLINLQVIDLSDNRFTEFPRILCEIRGLRVVDLRRNKVKVLSREVVRLKRLQELRIDIDIMTYPDERVCSAGLPSIISFLTDEMKKFDEVDYNCEDENMNLDEKTDERVDRNCDDEEEDDGQEDEDDGRNEYYYHNDAYQKYLTKKEQRKLNLMQWEQKIKDDLEMQTACVGEAQERKRNLLHQILREDSIVRSDFNCIQIQKIKDKNTLMDFLLDVENHSKKLIGNLHDWADKRRQQEDILNEIDDYNESLMTRQTEQLNLRKMTVMNAMEKLIQESLNNEINADQKASGKLNEIMAQKEVDKEAIRTSLLEEDTLQRKAFELLQQEKDSQHQLIRSQITLIENELANLTQAEMQRKGLKLDSIINNISEHRTSLASILSQLIEEKNAREAELRRRLVQLEEKLVDDCRSAENFWLFQYQRVIEDEPINIRLKQLDLDDKIKCVLLNCDDELVSKYVDVFVMNSLTFEQLMEMSEKDLMALGIPEYEVCLHIKDKVNQVMIESRDSMEPSAPYEDDDEGQASAPPMDMEDVKLWCHIECVVCLDRNSVVVFLPCGHLCCCDTCSMDLVHCPMCRIRIRKKTKQTVTQTIFV